MIWITAIALTLIAGFVACRLGRSTSTVASHDSPGVPAGGTGSSTKRLILYLVAIGCAAIASLRLPGVLFSIAPWLWLAAGYLWGLSSERRGTVTGPTGRVHGEHAPYTRDRDN